MKLYHIVFVALILLGLSSCSEKITEKPFINPPFPGYEKVFADTTFKAELGISFSYETGSVITIPPDAWADSLGNPIKGDVTVKYREFHEASEIFLAGMPLAYDTAGVTQNLSTAGMFEIRAMKDSSEIQIQKGKELQIKMASYTAEDDYSFYMLDEEAKNWAFTGNNKPEINKKIKEIADTIERLEPEIKFPLEEDKFFALNYSGLIDVVFRNKFWENKKSTFPKSKAKKYGLEWSGIEGGFNSIYFHGVEKLAFEMVWENLSGKKMPRWVNKDSYLNEIIKIGKDLYILKLVSGKKKMNLKVKAIMPIRQLFALKPETWQNNYDVVMKRIEEEQKRMLRQCAVFRTFNISTTGTHNWDRVYHRKDKVYVNADFKFGNQIDEKLADIDIFYFVDNNKSFVKFSSFDTDSIMLVPDSSCRFVAVLSPTEAAIFSPKEYQGLDFSKITANQNMSFDMKTVKINSDEDIQKLLN